MVVVMGQFIFVIKSIFFFFYCQEGSQKSADIGFVIEFLLFEIWTF